MSKAIQQRRVRDAVLERAIEDAYAGNTTDELRDAVATYFALHGDDEMAVDMFEALYPTEGEARFRDALRLWLPSR